MFINKLFNPVRLLSVLVGLSTLFFFLSLTPPASVQAGIFSPEPNPNQASVSQLHVILLGDTNDSESFKVDLNRIKENLIKPIEKNTDLKMPQGIIELTSSNGKFTIDGINAAFAQLQVKPDDDVVIFYYAGHGQNPSYATDPKKILLPNMLLDKNAPLGLQQVADHLRNTLKPRLTLILADTCNRFKPPSLATPSPIESRDTKGISIDLRSRYKALFEDYRGIIIGIAAKPGQKAWAVTGGGGFFTSQFLSSFHQEINTQQAPSWCQIMTRAAKLINVQMPEGLQEQQPRAKIFSDIEACSIKPEKNDTPPPPPPPEDDKTMSSGQVIIKNPLVLLIGNATYQKGQGLFESARGNTSSQSSQSLFPNLNSPELDIRAIRRVLEKQFGRNITIIEETNLDKYEIRRALDNFSEQLERDRYDFGLVYFSGHGFHARGKNYIVPIGAQDSVPNDNIAEPDIIRYLDKRSEKYKMLILDACRDNQSKNTNSLGSFVPIRKYDVPASVIVAYAASENTFALDGSQGRINPYADSWVQQFAKRGKELQAMLPAVRTMVIDKTRDEQRPTYILGGREQKSGEICFNLCSEEKFDEDYICDGRSVCRHITTQLPLRVLPKVNRSIYPHSKVSQAGRTVVEKPFWPLYVHEQEKDRYDNLWYKVCSKIDPRDCHDRNSGWMQKADIVLWKIPLLVAYSPIENNLSRDRRPVLVFDTEEDIKRVAENEREINSLYNDIERRNTLPNYIIAAESLCFKDIVTDFRDSKIIIPITDHLDFPGRFAQAKYLRIEAATPKIATTEVRDLYYNRGFRFNRDTCHLKPQDVRAVIDVKFVMDLTWSMRNYADWTITALSNVLTDIEKNRGSVETDPKVQYGFIGYRDDTKLEPWQRFTKLNVNNYVFKEDRLASPREFRDRILPILRTTSNPKGDFAEAGDAGILTAINSTWRSNAVLKILVLIGDASMHPVGHPKNTTGLNPQQLRAMADDNDIIIIAIHLKNPDYRSDHSIAEEQFKELSRNKKLGPTYNKKSYYIQTPLNNERYIEAAKFIFKTLLEKSQNVPEAIANKPDIENIQRLRDIAYKAEGFVADAMGQSFMNYLATNNAPDSEFSGWVLSTDLQDHNKPAVDIQIMLRREELSNLEMEVKQRLNEARRAETKQVDFFDSIQGATTTTMHGQMGSENQAQAQAMLNQGQKGEMLANWIEALPYNSDLQSIDRDDFVMSGPTQKASLKHTLSSKLKYYRETLNNRDRWVRLDDSDSRLDEVCLIPLTQLP